MNRIEKQSEQTHPGARISVVLGLGLLLVSCVLIAEFGLGRSLLAEGPDKTDHAPSGWFLAGSKPANYRTGVDKATTHEGQPSAYLLSAVPNTEGFGTLMQSIDAENYAGKRVRLRASVESQDVSEWAGMWMRVDKERKSVAFDNMQDRAIKGTQPWSTYDVVLDVPEDATGISFGILLSGAGEVWVSHVTLEEVGKETQTTGTKPDQRPLSKTPVNLNFSN